MSRDIKTQDGLAVSSDFESSIDDETALKLFHYWLRKANGRDVPLVRDIDICEIPKLLPHIVLYEVAEQEPRFTVRLMGEEVRRVMPNVRPGMTLEEMHGQENWLKIQSLYHGIVNDHRPHYINQPLYFRAQYYKNLRRILLPLADDQGRVRRIIGTAVFVNGRANVSVSLRELELGQARARE